MWILRHSPELDSYAYTDGETMLTPGENNTNLEVPSLNQELYLRKTTTSPYDYLMDSLMVDIPYPEMGFEEPTLWDNIKHYSPKIIKNIILNTFKPYDYVHYTELIDLMWNPTISDRAKKIRMNQAIREWNTPLENENRYKMELINFSQEKYVYTADDQWIITGLAKGRNLLYGMVTGGMASIITPDINIKEGDVQITKRIQYRITDPIMGTIPNYHKDAPLKEDKYMHKGVYVRKINLFYRDDKIVSARYNWRYHRVGYKMIVNDRNRDLKYTIIGEDY